MLVDANLLVFAANTADAQHEAAGRWLDERLAGPERVALPWLSLGAFLRITTNPRALPSPLDTTDALSVIEGWLGAPVAWVPEPGLGYASVLGDLMRRHAVRGPLVTDAMLAALALEHGLTVYSADTDFARFTEVRWVNPLA